MQFPQESKVLFKKYSGWGLFNTPANAVAKIENNKLIILGKDTNKVIFEISMLDIAQARKSISTPTVLIKTKAGKIGLKIVDDFNEITNYGIYEMFRSDQNNKAKE
ncbi:MAG TPA: hypothetical protein VII55_02825 [Candidatus Saccharimonadales bacterium]